MNFRKTLVIATHNNGKYREFCELLSDVPVEIAYLGSLAPDWRVDETGVTFEANAQLKASASARQVNMPALADDSGLEVDALDGAPGVYSARFAGAGANDAANIDLLLERLKGVALDKRRARFRCVLALASPVNDEVMFAHGVLEGSIALEARGSQGFGYDPVFVPEHQTLTLSELGASFKQLHSHRAQAFGQMRVYLARFLGK